MYYKIGEIVINYYRSTIFEWTEETQEITDQACDMYRCRLATDIEAEKYWKKRKQTKELIIKTKELGIKIKGKGSRFREVNYTIVVKSIFTYTRLKEIQTQLNTNSIDEALNHIVSTYNLSNVQAHEHLRHVKNINDDLLKYIKHIHQIFDSGKSILSSIENTMKLIK